MTPFLTSVVADVMTSDMVSLVETDTLSTARDLFHIHEYSALPVVDGKTMRGWLTQYDLLKPFLFDEGELVPSYEDILAHPVSTVMQREVDVVTTTETLIHVLRRMIETRYHSYPVVDDVELLGIITRADIFKGLHPDLYRK